MATLAWLFFSFWASFISAGQAVAQGEYGSPVLEAAGPSYRDAWVLAAPSTGGRDEATAWSTGSAREMSTVVSPGSFEFEGVPDWDPVYPENTARLPTGSMTSVVAWPPGPCPENTACFPTDSSCQGVCNHRTRVGYDNGFLIASEVPVSGKTTGFRFQMRINGYTQLRNLDFESSNPDNLDQREFQVQRARLIFSGNAYNPNLKFFLQMDGRSSSGDDLRLLDYFLDYDIGHDLWGYAPGRLGILAGKFKMPFQLARWLSGQHVQFTDRSMSSMYFDVNRSIAWGLYGHTDWRIPVRWEASLFNGLVTGGAETGSSGALDKNFAYSGRLFAFPMGQWGDPSMADLTYHQSLATRVGVGFANSTIDRNGSTEFSSVRVVDSGATLASLLPLDIDNYTVSLFSVDASLKFRGLSTTLEYYFRVINKFGGGSLPNLFDHGFWLQTGYFVVPKKLELLARWSTVTGNSGTLGQQQESSSEVAMGIGWYINGHHSKLTIDLTRLDGAPIDSSALNIFPGYAGWLYRGQVQISF